MHLNDASQLAAALDALRSSVLAAPLRAEISALSQAPDIILHVAVTTCTSAIVSGRCCASSALRYCSDRGALREAARCRPTSLTSRRTLVELCRSRPALPAELGPQCVAFGPRWPASADVVPHSAEFWPNFGRLRPGFDQLWAFRPDLARFGQQPACIPTICAALIPNP